MGEWDNWIGRSITQRDLLTPALLNRFRATLDSNETGDIAPQAIHWILCTPNAATADLGRDGHPLRDADPNSFMPPIPLPRRMWASSKVEFISPIRIGAAIERTSKIASISEKSGSTGRLAFVDVAHETRVNGILSVNETQTLVYRDATSAEVQACPAIKAPDFSLWDFNRSLIPDETLLFRFSAMTFNTHRIHYDAPYATVEEGYRGLVVHGPLMASLLLDLAAQEFGCNPLKYFGFRALSPAFASEPLHLVGRREGDAVTLAALGSDARICLLGEGR
jgi:3-methylfumaryl-CoA hydratase